MPRNRSVLKKMPRLGVTMNLMFCVARFSSKKLVRDSHIGIKKIKKNRPL